MALDLNSLQIAPGLFEGEMLFVLAELSRWGPSHYVVWLGFGCRNLEVLRVSARELRRVVEGKVRDGSFVPGEANLYVESAEGGIELLLCHDGDIHVTTEDARFAELLRSRWLRRGLGCQVQDSKRAWPDPARDPAGLRW